MTMHLSKITLTTLLAFLTATILPSLQFRNNFFFLFAESTFSLSSVQAQTIQDRQAQGNLLLTQGIEQLDTGEFLAALEFLQQAVAIYQELGDRAQEATTLIHLGTAYHSLGNYLNAINYLQQSLAIIAEIGDRSAEGNARLGLGITYTKLGDYTSGIEFIEQALIITRELGDREGEGVALKVLGVAYSQQKDYARAIEYFQASLEIAQEIGNRKEEANALGNLGIVHATLQDLMTSQKYFEQCLSIFQAIGDRQGEAGSLLNFAVLLSMTGESALATDYLQQSLAIARQIGDLSLEGLAFGNLGMNFLRSGDLTQAESNLRSAIEVWEKMRQNLGEKDGWKVAIFEQQANTYWLLQEVLIEQNRQEEALEIAERGRARAFVELMVRRGGTTRMTQGNIEPPNIAQIQQIAQTQNAVLVEYSVISEKNLYIWVIQPTGEIAFRSVNLSQLENSLTDLAQQGLLSAATSRIRGATDNAIEDNTVTPETVPNQSRIHRNLQQLHQLLIEPIADLLPTDPNQAVIFIPQGSLFLVPFAALQDANGNYLIQRHTILTAPAIQVLELIQQQPTNRNEDILIVGNPTMPKLPTIIQQASEPLQSLPGAEQEATAIASLLNTEFLSGDNATEAVVKARMPQARTIHLATHGLLEDTGNGMLAAIALAPSSSDDGLLTPDEILALDLNADLVVLSACDTGRGQITGDGVLGLSRSILTAGAASTIVSLWRVPDQSTAVLMTEFYRQWQQSGNKAQALRQAMLTTLKEYPHPMYWAAFTLMGKQTTH